MPDGVLAGNLNRMREYLAGDRELAPHAEKILRDNARRLFDKK